MRKEKINYITKYNREHYKMYGFRLKKENQQKVINWLNSKGSLNEYVTGLIIADMNKN